MEGLKRNTGAMRISGGPPIVGLPESAVFLVSSSEQSG